ncbi:uncharacterized protein LOC106663495 [Cimex lectularius]|uniref:Dynein axonemal intermediate chain 4 n=1 Tax=Cimex lectularius TaxID=79782 RepID=A0A8I6RH84_CIMLE|nr:uncharacterized protein LOC106663495 [Cimex lectularius]
MEQFRDIMMEADSDEEVIDNEKLEEPKNPLQVEAAIKMRLDRLDESIGKTLKYVKKRTGHKPILRKLSFKHWKPVLQLIMRAEVLQEVVDHPSYKPVRGIALSMLEQLAQVKIKKDYVKKVCQLVKTPVTGFSEDIMKELVKKFMGEEGIQDRINAILKKRKKAELFRAKLNSKGVVISDKLERVLQIRENYQALKKNVLTQADERCKVLSSKKQYMDAMTHRKKIRDYFLVTWKNELEKEWSKMSRQASKLNACKHVRKRLREMKHKKKVMTVQLASLPATVRRHLITAEVTKMYRDIKRSVEEIKSKKPGFETIMLRNVEKRKHKKFLKVARKKMLMKEEESRQRAMRTRYKKKKLLQSQKAIKELQCHLRKTNEMIKQQISKPIIKTNSDVSKSSTLHKSVRKADKAQEASKASGGESLGGVSNDQFYKKITSMEEIPIKLKDEGFNIKPDSVMKVEVGESTDLIPDASSMFLDDKDNTWRKKKNKRTRKRSVTETDNKKRTEMKRISYFEKIQKKIEKNELVEMYTKRLHERIMSLNKASAEQHQSKQLRDSIGEQLEFLEEILAKRKEINSKLEDEMKAYEDIQEQIKLSKKWKKMKRRREREMLKMMEKDLVLDFPDDRQPLWSITGDGWSWTGYRVYSLDDCYHPWGFTQGLRERTPLQLGTTKYPASHTISGYTSFVEFTENLKNDYIKSFNKASKQNLISSGSLGNIRLTRCESSIGDKSMGGNIASKASNATLTLLMKKLTEGLDVPHIPGRIARPDPLPDFVDPENEDFVPRESGPPAFPLREDPIEPEQTYGYKYVVRLMETETLTLFEKESTIVYSNSEEAEELRILETVAKENKRKRETFEINVSDALTQIVPKPQGNFAALITAPERKSIGIYACMGDIQSSQVLEAPQEIDPNLAYLAALASSEEEDDDDSSPRAIVCSKAFHDVANTIERILSTNPYLDHLIAYQGALVPDPYAPVVEINIVLVYLWTFKYPKKVHERKIKRQSVSSIAWSDKLEAVIAVGYGSFYSTTFHYGLICIWNLKNLMNPERIMTYKAGVCHVEFSSKHPYILSCSFQDGFIAVYNIYPQIPSILCDNKKCTVHAGEPVWQVSWMNNSMGEEVLVAGGQTGEFYAYAKQSFSRPNILMAITRKEGMVVGFEDTQGVCTTPKLNSVPAIMCFVPVPADKENFLVGTDDGSVRVISLFARNLQTDLFNAHRDKINRIEFSPFCSKLFFTVGGDFALRIWVYGLKSPILSLVARDMYIEDAAWSPANPSLLVSVGGIYIDLWDLGRCGIGKPIATATNPRNKRNSNVRFSNNGRNIAVGDIWGDVHIFCFDKMPFDPLLTQEALLRSLANALAFTPEILNQVVKIGHPFDRLSNIVKKKEKKEDAYTGKKDK